MLDAVIPPWCAGANHVSKILSDGGTSGDFDEISNGRASSTALSMSPLPGAWAGAGTGRFGHLQPGGSSAVSERPPTSTTWRVIIHWLSWFLLEEKCWGVRKSVCAEGPERTPTPATDSQSRTATTTPVCLCPSVIDLPSEASLVLLPVKP